MKIHVEFNSIADMANFTKFINDSLVPPTQKQLKNRQQEANKDETIAKLEEALKSKDSRLEQLLDRALERIAMLDPNGETANLSPAEYAEKKRAEKVDFDPALLLCNIGDLPITHRVYNCLTVEGIRTIGDLVKCTENDLLRLPNFGRKSLRELKETLAEHKLTLKQPK